MVNCDSLLHPLHSTYLCWIEWVRENYRFLPLIFQQIARPPIFTYSHFINSMYGFVYANFCFILFCFISFSFCCLHTIAKPMPVYPPNKWVLKLRYAYLWQTRASSVKSEWQWRIHNSNPTNPKSDQTTHVYFIEQSSFGNLDIKWFICIVWIGSII